MGYREKNFQELAESNLRRVVDDFHGFGVAGLAAADVFVVGIFDRAAGIAGGGAGDAFDVLEDGLHAPETASCDYQSGLTFLGGEGFVHRGIGEGGCGAGGVVAEYGEKDQECGTENQSDFYGAIHFFYLWPTGRYSLLF